MAVFHSQSILSTSSLPQEPTVSLKVSTLSQDDYAAWDEYVIRNAHGTPFHLIAWKKTIEESFYYKPHYLIARDQSIRGILPLFFVHNAVIGKALISSPFAVYGGILADSKEAHRMLFDRAKALGEQLRVDYIELRNWNREQCVGEPNVSRYVAFHQELGMD